MSHVIIRSRKFLQRRIKISKYFRVYLSVRQFREMKQESYDEQLFSLGGKTYAT